VGKKNKGGLGRGLDALLGDAGDLNADLNDDAEGRLESLPLSEIEPGDTQPRKRMDDAALAELSDSIRRQGVISPIIVRRAKNGRYRIIAGERRFRAAGMAGLETIPAIVREADTQNALEMALIENMQREDLNPLEEAEGIARLIKEFGYTHEKAAEAIGRSRAATTNLLRLLDLTAEVRRMLMDGELEMGHARALLALSGADQILAAKEVIAKALSVRQTEALVRRLTEKQPAKKKVVIKTRDDLRVEEALAETLGAVVKLSANRRGKGRIVIEFSNLEQLQGIVERIEHGSRAEEPENS
jgi:ParB family chromosome partitioning protein